MSDRDRLARNLADRGYLVEPDPLTPPDWNDDEAECRHRERLAYAAALAIGDRNARRAFAGGLIFGALIVVLCLAIAYLTIAYEASRSGQTTVSTSPPRDLSAARLTLSAGQSGAPRPPVVMPAAGMRRGSASGNPPAAAGAPSVTGPATWYDAPSPTDAAAGPSLRKALGPHWRGSVVRVCAKACVTTTLTDWCACGHGRVIDLDNVAFARLAPLSQGVVRVRVTLVGAIDVPLSTERPLPTGPRTDTEGGS